MPLSNSQWCLVVAFLSTLCSACFAQDPKEQEIVTDRPDITESAVVVPLGTLQDENGLTWANYGGKAIVDLSESLFRLGLGHRTELRFEVPNYIHGLGGGRSPSGFDDVSIGIKEQLGPLPGGFDLAVIAAVGFPTGAKSVSTHGFDPFIKLPWSRELTGPWSVGGMQSFFYSTEDERRNPTWESTFYLERELTKSSDAFLEYSGDYPRFGGSRQIIHLGMAYRFKPLHQVDFHFGFGLSEAAPGYFLAAGYSFRIDKLFGALRK